MELNLERFSPAKAELHGLVEKAKLITKESPAAEVHEMRSLLRSTRTSITKTGKAMREDAIKFQKDVIAKEKELVGIIEPEEARLAEIEDEMERARQREERMSVLPHRKARLEAIGDGIFETDDHLLDMDGPTFEVYFNQRQAEKNAADQRVLEEREAALRAEEERQRREKETREREEKARQEEREHLAREQRDKEEREAREKKEAEEKAAREEAMMRRNERIRAYFTEMGWTEELEARGQFKIERLEDGNKIVLWKRAGTFEILAEDN